MVGERVGRIEQGYLADLVVVDGDPTANVRVLLDIESEGLVVKGGSPVAGWA